MIVTVYYYSKIDHANMVAATFTNVESVETTYNRLIIKTTPTSTSTYGKYDGKTVIGSMTINYLLSSIVRYDVIDEDNDIKEDKTC